jgi:hypothetical protein
MEDLMVSMEVVLDLQTLEVPEEDSWFGNSCSSSGNTCCNS